MKTWIVAAVFAALGAFTGPCLAAPDAMATSSETYSAVPDTPLPVPKSGKIKVAFLVSDNFNLIDMAGPMQTFLQVGLPPYGDNAVQPFSVFTVADSRKPIKAYGGLEVIPNYTFADAPDADIVVVGAQPAKDPGYVQYLKRMSAQGKVVASVCTGLTVLLRTGLLEGKTATSHHAYIADFRKLYPHVTFLSDKAYVRSAPLIFTAGGETSGFEMALHVVQLYYGREVAVRTARSMEYRGPAWQN